MAKQPKPKAPNPKPAKGPPPGTGAGTTPGRSTPPATLFGSGIAFDQALQQMPGFDTNRFTSTDQGVQAYLSAMGVPPDRILDYMTTANQGGVAKMLADLSDPQFASGAMPGLQAGSPPGASTDATSVVQTAPGGQPIEPTQLRQMVEGIAAGLGPLGDVRKVRASTPGLTVEARTRRAVPASQQAAAPGATPQPGGQPPVPPVTPKQMMPFADQVEAKRQSYVDRGMNPPPVLPTVSTAISRNLPSILAAGGGLTALGVGAYGLGRGMSGGAPQPQQQPIMPQDEEQQLRQMLEDEMRMPPQQQMPVPQEIPAGSPPPSNSTLMRLMQSRSV